MTGQARQSHIKTGDTVLLVDAVTRRKKASLEVNTQTYYWSDTTKKPYSKKEDLRMVKSGKFRKMSGKEKVFECFLLLIMTVLCAIIFYPLYYVAVASVTDSRIVNTGKALLYPEALYLDGYRTIFAYPFFGAPYKNTLIYTAAVSVYNLLVCRSYFEAGLWEEVWNAILFLRDEEKMPLQVQLTWMSGSELKYCTVMVAALPFLLIYPFFQKYFVQGGSIRGVKI